MNATTKWEVEVASDVYNAGVSEDGETMEGLSFYLVAMHPNGRQFAHKERFNSPARFALERTKTAVNALLVRVQTAIAAGKWLGPVGRAYWTEIDPAYGSEAYASNWVAIEGERKAQEIREDE